jgi:hypothetical protein
MPINCVQQNFDLQIWAETNEFLIEYYVTDPRISLYKDQSSKAMPFLLPVLRHT